MPCLEHLAQLRERKDEFDRLTAEVLVVSFEPIERASMFAREEGIPFTVVSDLQRDAYRHFGFGRSRLRPWSPLAVFAYLRAAFSGRRVRLPQASVSQLGGDVVLNAGGSVVLVHRSAHAADRPSADELLEAVAGRTRAGDAR